MTFYRQSTGGTFVAFGKDKAKEDSYVVEKGKYLECFVQSVKENDRFGLILEVKTKDTPDVLIVTGTTVLNRELGYEWDNADDKGNFELLKDVKQCQADYRVVAGDLIRINFEGMIKTKKGKDAYNLYVEVDKEEKKPKK